MRRRVELDVRRDEDIVSNRNFVAVHERAIHIHRNIVSERDVASIIAQKWRSHADIFADARKKASQDFAFARLLLDRKSTRLNSSYRT